MKTKIVKVPFRVDRKSKWMAFDANGALYTYTKEPVLCFYNNEWRYDNCLTGPVLKIRVPRTPCDPDWWEGTLRRVKGGVAYIQIKAPQWANWMAFGPTGWLCFFDTKPSVLSLTEECALWMSTRSARSPLCLKVPDDVYDCAWWTRSIREI
jgi:hypothetical protein